MARNYRGVLLCPEDRRPCTCANDPLATGCPREPQARARAIIADLDRIMSSHDSLCASRKGHPCNCPLAALKRPKP